MKTNPLVVAAGIAAVSAVASQAQIIRQWSHQSTFGEASAAVGLDPGYMVVADNEDEFLRLYERFPDSTCAAPVYTFNVRPNLNLSSSNPEADIEAAVKAADGNDTRIYWLGSHSNSKSGNLRPNRNRLFATQVNGDGSAASPFSLGYVGRYDHLRTDLVEWDRNNLHGKGADYFGLAASISAGVLPTRIDGFNIEGLTLAPDGTAYLAFRAPLVNGSGPTTSLDQRTNALIVPLLNMPALVAGSPTAGPGAARFGEPFTLNLGRHGVRSIDCSHPGHYLITAGPAGETSNPPTAPYNFCLFTWTGDPAHRPIERRTEFPFGFSPEGAILPPAPITSETIAQFVSDDPNGCFRSFTACVAPETFPMLRIVPSGREVIVSWPASVPGFTLQHCTDLLRGDWVNNNSTVTMSGTDRLVVEPADGLRFYRLGKP